MAQTRASRFPVALAALAFAVAAGLFAAAFYFLDGAGVAQDLWASVAGVSPGEAAQTVTPPPAMEQTTLVLPQGMPDEFALRLWQEQIESQRVITQLVSGEVASLAVTGVDRAPEEARLHATITMKDGSTLPGVIGMRKYAGSWYISYASASRNGETAAVPSSELPATSDVDVELLNTIIAQQGQSAEVTQEYVDGKIESVSVEGVTMGPNTATIRLEMNEDHEQSYADFVALKREIDGEDVWFLARFEKTGSTQQQ